MPKTAKIPAMKSLGRAPQACRASPAPPAELKPPRKLYLVWCEQDLEAILASARGYTDEQFATMVADADAEWERREQAGELDAESVVDILIEQHPVFVRCTGWVQASHSA